MYQSEEEIKLIYTKINKESCFKIHKDNNISVIMNFGKCITDSAILFNKQVLEKYFSLDLINALFIDQGIEAGAIDVDLTPMEGKVIDGDLTPMEAKAIDGDLTLTEEEDLEKEENIFYAIDDVFTLDNEKTCFSKLELSITAQNAIENCLKNGDNLINPEKSNLIIPDEDLITIWCSKNYYIMGEHQFYIPTKVKRKKLFIVFHQEKNGDIKKVFVEKAKAAYKQLAA
jgi:hypothetical protein